MFIDCACSPFVYFCYIYFILIRSIVEFPFKSSKLNPSKYEYLFTGKFRFKRPVLNIDPMRRIMQILSTVLVLTIFYEITIIPSIAFSIVNGILGRTSDYFWLVSIGNVLSFGIGSIAFNIGMFLMQEHNSSEYDQKSINF